MLLQADRTQVRGKFTQLASMPTCSHFSRSFFFFFSVDTWHALIGPFCPDTFPFAMDGPGCVLGWSRGDHNPDLGSNQTNKQEDEVAWPELTQQEPGCGKRGHTVFTPRFCRRQRILVRWLQSVAQCWRVQSSPQHWPSQIRSYSIAGYQLVVLIINTQGS